jgi:hypothetical protein
VQNGATYLGGTIVDIRNLPRSGFVSMSNFLDLAWESLNCFNWVQRIALLENLTPFRKGFPCEEKECGSFFMFTKNSKKKITTI